MYTAQASPAIKCSNMWYIYYMKQKKDDVGSHSIRIPKKQFLALKERALLNNRPIVSELVVILDAAANQEIASKRKPRDYSDIIGIVKDLPPDNYSEKIDEILYGDLE